MCVCGCTAVYAGVSVPSQTSTIRFCSCVKFEPMCLLSGKTLILHSQCAHSMHFFWRSSRGISTPPYARAEPQGSVFAWMIGKKLDNITRNVSHARVKWLRNTNEIH